MATTGLRLIELFIHIPFMYPALLLGNTTTCSPIATAPDSTLPPITTPCPIPSFW